MARVPRRTAEQVADAIAHVCQHSEQIRSTLLAGSAGDSSPLEVVITALQIGDDPIGPLEDLHRALRAARDALGIYGHASRRYFELTGINSSVPRELVFLCPRAELRCTRFEWPSPAGLPQCRITGDHLRREVLPT